MCVCVSEREEKLQEVIMTSILDFSTLFLETIRILLLKNQLIIITYCNKRSYSLYDDSKKS